MKSSFTREDLNIVIKKLQEKKICFVSEAHLQTTFTIEASKLFGDKYTYLLEYVPKEENVPENYSNKNGLHFDLLVIDNESQMRTLIEFKYKTKKFYLRDKIYEVNLKNHGAQILGAYDCWKDIFRIESFVLEDDANSEYANGFFVFITNDNSYYSPMAGNHKYGDDFLMNEGIHEKGEKKWKELDKLDEQNKVNTIGKTREKSIPILKTYEFNYEQYLKYPEKNGKFKLLVVEIKK